MEPAQDQPQARGHQLLGRGAHHPVRLPRDPGSRRGHLSTAKALRPVTASPAPTPSPAPRAAVGTRTYNLSWTGNDGTFSTAASIALPLNSPTDLTVTVHPTSAGTHSAILNLDDPSTVGIDKQTLNTVVAAEQFTAANEYSITHSGTIGRNQVTSYFYNVPANTPAFKVDLVGGGSHTGCRADPLPAVPSLRCRLGRQLLAQLLQPDVGQLCRIADQSHHQQPPGWRLGGRGRGSANVGR